VSFIGEEREGRGRTRERVREGSETEREREQERRRVRERERATRNEQEVNGSSTRAEETKRGQTRRPKGPVHKRHFMMDKRPTRETATTARDSK